MLSRRQRLRWWLREQRLPKERRKAARAERWEEMAKFVEDHDARLADFGRTEAGRHESMGSDFHRA